MPAWRTRRRTNRLGARQGGPQPGPISALAALGLNIRGDELPVTAVEPSVGPRRRGHCALLDDYDGARTYGRTGARCRCICADALVLGRNESGPKGPLSCCLSCCLFMRRALSSASCATAQTEVDHRSPAADPVVLHRLLDRELALLLRAADLEFRPRGYPSCEY